MRVRKTTGRLVAATTAGLLLAGCGGGSDFASQSSTDIIAAARDAMADVESVRLTGEVPEDAGPITLDVRASRGGDCSGSISVEGATVEILSVDGETLIRPDEAFWQQQAGEGAADIIAAVGDRWVSTGDDDGFAELCDLDQLFDELGADADEDDAGEVGETSEIDGREVVAVAGEEDGGTATAFIATDDPHHILRLTFSGDEEGQVDLTEFNEPVEVERPADDEITSFDEL